MDQWELFYSVMNLSMVFFTFSCSWCGRGIGVRFVRVSYMEQSNVNTERIRYIFTKVRNAHGVSSVKSSNRSEGLEKSDMTECVPY